jgi:O-antigen/teichoic acid export membrane protein
MTGIVFMLTAVKVLAAASGFVTGPLLAHALGASGRGDLAAVQVPFALIPAVLALGIPALAYRELPRGRPPQEVIGSLGLPLVLIGLVVAAFSVPAADALAGGRAVVRTWLVVSFLATPLLLLSSLLSSCLVALERWRSVAVTTLAPFAVSLIGVTGLYLLGRLNVGTAAAVTVASGLAALMPAIPMVVALPRPAFRRSLARRGIGFGLKAWAGGLALLANMRLDQLLMITAVSPRVLGLYAVATTIAGASALATWAVAQPVMPRVAAGERSLVPRAVRAALLTAVSTNIGLALLTPVLLTTLFGPEFRAAVPMTLILLLAAVPYGATVVLSAALQADGAPVIPSLAEGFALVMTVVGLLVLLPLLGGIGAAIVSVAAYSTSFAFQLVWARRRFSTPLRSFLIPHRDDARWLRSLVADLTSRLRVARGSRKLRWGA